MKDKIFTLKKPNLYFERKTRKSDNPAVAFFQRSSREQKKDWKKIVEGAYKMQKDLMDS